MTIVVLLLIANFLIPILFLTQTKILYIVFCNIYKYTDELKITNKIFSNDWWMSKQFFTKQQIEKTFAPSTKYKMIYLFFPPIPFTAIPVLMLADQYLFFSLVINLFVYFSKNNIDTKPFFQKMKIKRDMNQSFRKLMNKIPI